MQILIIIILTFITFIPVVFWGYTFSYIDSSNLNRKRFFVWLLAWIVSVLPILYTGKLSSVIKYLDLSKFISNLKNWFSFFDINLSLIIFLLLFILISLLIKLFNWKISLAFKAYTRSFLMFLWFIFALSLSFFLIDTFFSQFSFLDFWITNEVYFWWVLLNTFKLIIFYYLIVAFLEETSKYFNFLGSSFSDVNSTKKAVLYAIFVALWFSFIENILYLLSSYNWSGFSYDLVKLYFFRSVFSIILHILCSSILALGFYNAITYYNKNWLSLKYIKIFFLWLFFSILLHSLFDIFLTLWFWFVIIIYLIWWYLYVSSIFYKE